MPANSRWDFNSGFKGLNAKEYGGLVAQKECKTPQFQKKMLYGKLYATRRRWTPKMRWLDDVSMDLRKMGLNEWKDKARNRKAQRHIVEEAKAHPGCSAIGREVCIMRTAGTSSKYSNLHFNKRSNTMFSSCIVLNFLVTVMTLKFLLIFCTLYELLFSTCLTVTGIGCC